MDSEIRVVLRPDQQARYDELIKDSERRFSPADGASDGPPEPMP